MRRRTEDFCPIHRAKVCSGRIFMQENRLRLHAYIVCMLGGIPPKYRELVASKEQAEGVGNSAPEVL